MPRAAQRMPPITIDVTSERGSYSVLVGAGLSAEAGALVTGLDPAAGRVVVTAAPIWRRHGPKFRGLTRRQPPVLIPDGERAKTLATVARLYEAFTARRLDRSAIVVGVGGGVLGDTGGFAAATFLRGLRFVQIPTTLVAQVDSAIGGKVGVNLPAGKNLAGSFHAPRLVICDPTLLRTLPRREFRAGLYEVVKYGVIASRPLFDRVSQGLDGLFLQDPSLLTAVIAECCRIKAAVVMRDEREAGPRRVLNFGHTVGHALETVTGYRRFRHGEAVGYGMLAAARLSAMRGLLRSADEARLGDLIARLGPLPVVADLRVGDVLDAMTRDKKRVGGRLHVVLAKGLGDTAIVDDVTARELRTAVRALGLS
jgi:3-dehydroquinate synthase